MNKNLYRKYLLHISEYLNIFAICQIYNKSSKFKIDYNNLRAFIKDKKNSKISEDKLEKIVYFIKQEIGIKIILEEDKEKHIIERTKKEFTKDIINVIKKCKGGENEI